MGVEVKDGFSRAEDYIARHLQTLDRIYDEYEVKPLSNIKFVPKSDFSGAEAAQYWQGLKMITFSDITDDAEGIAAHEVMHHMLGYNMRAFSPTVKDFIRHQYLEYMSKTPTTVYGTKSEEEFVCETFRKMITKKTLHTNEEKVTAQVIDRVFKKKK